MLAHGLPSTSWTITAHWCAPDIEFQVNRSVNQNEVFFKRYGEDRWERHTKLVGNVATEFISLLDKIPKENHRELAIQYGA